MRDWLQGSGAGKGLIGACSLALVSLSVAFAKGLRENHAAPGCEGFGGRRTYFPPASSPTGQGAVPSGARPVGEPSQPSPDAHGTQSPVSQLSGGTVNPEAPLPGAQGLKSCFNRSLWDEEFICLLSTCLFPVRSRGGVRAKVTFSDSCFRGAGVG